MHVLLTDFFLQKKNLHTIPVPGQENRQECGRVQHERRHGVEDVGVRVDEVLSTNLPAQEQEQGESNVAGVRQQQTDQELEPS
jgi:hypothetical protein